MSNAPTDPQDDARPAPVLNYSSPASEQNQWVTIWTARDSVEANLAAGALRGRGLTARVDSENTATLGAWGGAGPGTSTKIQVLSDEAEAARTILADVERARERRQGAEGVKCPKCGAAGADRVFAPGRWFALAAIVVGIVLMSVLTNPLGFPLMLLGVVLLIWPMTPKWRCKACGHRWRAPVPDGADESDQDDEDDEGGDDD